VKIEQEEQNAQRLAGLSFLFFTYISIIAGWVELNVNCNFQIINWLDGFGA
jgi:hypothetical protein